MRATIAGLRSLLEAGAPDPDLPRLGAELLRHIAAGRSDLAPIRHPLGFLYAPLDRRPDSVLRLHVWPNRPAWRTITTTGYHRHAWDLVSFVQAGRIANVVLDVEPSAGDRQYRVFEVLGDGDVDLLAPTDELVRPAAQSTQLVAAGELYRVAAGDYHASRVEDAGWAVTIALVNRVPGATERALGAVSLGRHSVTRQASTPAELAAAARHVMAQART